VRVLKTRKQIASEHKARIKRLDKLLSQVKRKMQGGVCEVCGVFCPSGAAHYFGKKAYPHIRYDLRNVLWACYKCHILRGHIMDDSEPLRDAIIKREGMERFERLKRRAYMYEPLTIDQYDEIEQKFKDYLKEGICSDSFQKKS
jgi:Pyruvate/2-oxoacid:ferredoxin oxidoreductase delta subunit